MTNSVSSSRVIAYLTIIRTYCVLYPAVLRHSGNNRTRLALVRHRITKYISFGNCLNTPNLISDFLLSSTFTIILQHSF